MGLMIRRHIGQILLDGRFLSKPDLNRALEEQKHTKELLGQVLVRMGVLDESDINAPLIMQKHLGCLGDAVKIAAGERQLLGTLLVESGQITGEQLDFAIAEQKRTGEKLGEVFLRLKMLTKGQLNALLDFQNNQEMPHESPLRLGELLVATGHISRGQLDRALLIQAVSRKKLGEILVEEGFVRQDRVKSGIRLQKMLLNSVLAAILALGMGATSHASSVQLQWDPNVEPDLAGYKVYYSSDPSQLASSVPIDVQKQTTTTISGLDPAKTYDFAVTAYNAAGQESSMSNIVKVLEQTAPVLAISAPANGTSVSGVVSFSVNATDNVGVTRVEFSVNSQQVAVETSAPYVYSWDTRSLPPGGYTLTAKAYDAAGNISVTSSSVTVVNDITAPAVALTSPANNATVSGMVAISAGASDNVAVSKVEFYSNGVLLYATNISPYSYNWNTISISNGIYALTAKAYDNAGNVSQSSTVNVTVSNSVADVTAPALSGFTIPSSSTTLTVPVSGVAATDNVGVTGYLITESSAKPLPTAGGWSATPPASFTFSSPGTKTAYAWAKDAAGNVSSSIGRTVTITLPDTIAPVVSIPSPVSGSIVKGIVTVTAGASDNVSVAKVEFYVNGVLKYTKTSAPYTYSWNTKAEANGEYALSVMAFDSAGNAGQSGTNTVTVKNRIR